MSGVVSYPTPPYRNPPIQPYYYVPQVFIISAITLGAQTTVTTSIDNNYDIGQLVRLVIPASYGASQLNQQTGYVIGIPAANQVILNINSVGYNTFNTSTNAQQPQLVPVGDINSGVVNNMGRINNQIFINGSFRDIS